MVAFALGLLISVVIIFMRENMNTRVRGRKDLENLTIPFIGEIPLFTRKKKGILGKKPQEVKAVVVKEGNRDIINEAFRVLRTNLEFMTGKDKTSNVIIMTSFNPGSGKSFLTMNIAMSLAIKGKKSAGNRRRPAPRLCIILYRLSRQGIERLSGRSYR